MKRLIAILFLCSLSALAQQATVTGHIQTPGGVATSNATITFNLLGTGSQQCRVAGTGAIAPTKATAAADPSTGAYSLTLYRNDFITCGNQQNTQWQYVIFNGTLTQQPCTLPQITTSSLNIDSTNCTNTVPVVTPPTGDNTYCRLDGSNCGFTGNVSMVGGSFTGTYTAGPTYNISTVSESGNVVTVTTAVPCTAITGSGQSIVVSGVGVSGYNSGPGGLVGFFTAGSCSGSTFTYFNPTSGLASSSGGTVTVSPIFSQGLTHTGPETISGQLTMTNHNQFFWAGPGATPTIDQAVTACGTNPCIVDISPGYTGAESANLTTTSLGYKVYNGANNVTIIDHRQVDTGVATATNLYGMMFGGRNAGALNRVAVNYYAHSPSDSSTGTNGFNWIDGTLPSNNGAQYGSISFATTHDTLTIGSSTSQIAGGDSEAYHNATTVDKDLPYIAGHTFQSGMSRAGAVGNIGTSVAAEFNACANVSSTGKIENCYGGDFLKSTNGVAANYSIHGYSSLWEASHTYDYADAGFNINAASESGTTVTITTSATCNLLTGQRVRISGVGTTQLGYNGIWTVLTPGCNGGSTFTYTNTASGLATLGAGGIAAGLYTFIGPNATGDMTQVARSYTFKTPDLSTKAQITSSGLFAVGTIGPIADNGTFLGGSSQHFAGLFQTICQLGGAAGTSSPAACSGATSGKIAIPASQTTYQINTANVTTNSIIFVQQTTSNAGLPSSPTCNSGAASPMVSAISNGTSFTFTLTSVAAVTCFNFWFVN